MIAKPTDNLLECKETLGVLSIRDSRCFTKESSIILKVLVVYRGEYNDVN